MKQNKTLFNKRSLSINTISICTLQMLHQDKNVSTTNKFGFSSQDVFFVEIPGSEWQIDFIKGVVNIKLASISETSQNGPCLGHIRYMTPHQPRS